MQSGNSELFRSERLRVRSLNAGDVPGLFSVYGDAEAMRWVDDGRPIRLEACERWIEVTQRNVRERGYGMCALELLPDGELVGFCGLVHPGGQLEVEIKYALARAHWGRGLATEAVRAMLAWGARTFGIDAVIATIDPDNGASRRVLEKAGLRLRERPLEPDGSSCELLAISGLCSGA